MVIDKRFYMKLALNEAWKYQGLTYPNPAVGCCIVGNHGEILSVEAHKKAGKPHAEVEALKKAYFQLSQDDAILELEESVDIHNYLLKNHNNYFANISLYTTLEPCSHVGKTPSCASLISLLGIKKVYVGSYDTNEIASGGNAIVQKSGAEVENELLRQECDALLAPFKAFSKEQFVFFKWAQRLNGTTDEGTISSATSRKHVHALRDKCDLLVIGGNTVRLDRPTLDARLVNGKAPDVLILSNTKEFDTTIPLFNVPNRVVHVESDFSKIKEYKNIMIEGSAKMYELTRDIVDYYLCYVAPVFGGSNGFEKVQDELEILNIAQEEKDIIMWMKLEKNR